MARRRSVVTLMSTIALLAFPFNIRAADAPLAMFQTATQKTVAVLQNPAYQGAAYRGERLAQVAATLLPYFDTEGMSQRALGLYWRQLTTDQQQEFVRLFTALVEHAYGGAIERHASDVQVLYEQERLNGNDAEVDTRVLAPAVGQPVSINYFLHQVNGQWLIYDVQIENVSLVLNYRSQFARILNTASYAELVHRLKGKLLEVDAPSS